MKKEVIAGDFANAVICHANYARFGHNDDRTILNVQSRMCLWCKSGKGEVKINGRSFSCENGDYFFLPWDHRIEYCPDNTNPFYLAGIHVIPDHSRKYPVEYEVPHDKNHRFYNCRWRHDLTIPPLKGIMHKHIGADSSLFLLSESIVQIFRSATAKNEGQIRLLAQALILELIKTFEKSGQQSFTPLHVRQLIEYIDSNYTKPISIDDLAKHSQRSKSGITGLFRKHYGKTPMQLIIRKRIDNACELLATTSLPVGEIGRLSGIDDQFYFSKLFKKMIGHSPLAYRKQNQRF